MKADKTFEQRLRSPQRDAPTLDSGLDHEAVHQSRLRLVVRRAIGTYLVLLFGLGMIMSLLGLDPLAHDGLMPKALLVFVGLALGLATINTLISAVQERDGSWVRLLWELARRQK